MAESQIRLALLTAFENSFSNPNGDMTFNGEIVRQRCQDMKCYDTANFSSIFKSILLCLIIGVKNMIKRWIIHYHLKQKKN